MPAAFYHNETLFSEIYLEEITRQPEQTDVLASLGVLKEYRDYAETNSLDAWRNSYIHEVLAALGFSYQAVTRHLTRLYPLGNTENGVSVCFTVLPEESLDNTRMGSNWAEKIIRALRENNLHWGLLTNGKQWRIYHLDESTPYETYLEIDLEAILKEKAKEAYQIFYKFMKAENFAAGVDGHCQFDRFKKESQDKIDYIEKELANALKQREEGGKGVLSDICMGYVEELRRQKEGNLDDEAWRKKIYHGAMLYMFRLLFLLYADARQLLSDRNHALLESVDAKCRTQHNDGSGDTASFSLWDSLEQIFVDIDQTYNGGLFSPQESEFTRFISETRIGDVYLANAIFNLTTYREKNKQEKPISYRDMSVRHLGTLYEGLLEHKLFITKEDTEVKVTKGIIQFIPASQGGKLVVGHYLSTGSVYFSGDPTERKSTGSYYTPEYIVNYIVRNTVGEKLKELREAFLKEEKANREALTRAVDETEHRAITSLLEENAQDFVRQKVLQLSVLDPAMGSGHFLVNATNLIANGITEIINELGIVGSLSSRTADWRRRVVENCIYGVDLNPLAVELAKLSLWILSMAKDQPLSFLNHHLKCGNSLVGARLEEVGNYPLSTVKKELQQLALFDRDPDFKTAVEDAITKSRMISAHNSTSLNDVEEKKAWLVEIEQSLNGYKAISNIHTSLYFGNLIDEKQYKDLAEKHNFTRAFELDKTNQYFHWELEFIDVLLDRSGFDCIIGNPPYVRQEKIKELKVYLENFTVYTGGADLFTYFYEKSLNLAKPKGLISFISSNSYLFTGSGKGLRRLLSSNAKIYSIVDFGNIRVFESADTFVAIIVYSNAYPPSDQIIHINKVEEAEGETLEEKINQHTLLLPQTSLSDDAWNLVNKRYKILLEKMIKAGTPLITLYGEPQSGIKTGANDILIIDKEKKEKFAFTPEQHGVILPFRGGEDIRPWYIEKADQWLIGIPYGWTKKNFPNIVSENKVWEEISHQYPGLSSYLNLYKKELSNRSDQGEFWWELRPCQYWSDLKKPKIVWPQFGKVPRWAMDEEGLYLKNSSYFLPTGDYFLLGLLNSRIIWFYVSQTCKPMGKRAGLWRYMLLAQYLEELPIPDVTDELRNNIQNIAKDMTKLLKNNGTVENRFKIKESANEYLQNLDRLVLEAFDLTIEDYELILEACPYTVDHALELS